MVNNAVIIPTGDEVFNGIVVDTNSPAIMGMILESFPACEVTRIKPVCDVEDHIVEVIEKYVNQNMDLIILIGGSGGGHRFVSTLGKDFTHSALMRYLTCAEYKEIYGKNGHLWSKLIAGKKMNSIIINVPGPYVEAVEASKAALNVLKRGESDLKILVEEISRAVFLQYPSGGEIK